MSLFSLCRLRITTKLRPGLVDKMAGIFTKRIYQPCICQPNELKREIEKKTEGDKRGAKQKSGGAWSIQAPLESPLTTNKSVERSHTPQETATDCGYVGLQANVLTVGLLANKYRIFSNISRVFLQGKQSVFRHIDLYSSHSISASDHVFSSLHATIIKDVLWYGCVTRFNFYT